MKSPVTSMLLLLLLLGHSGYTFGQSSGLKGFMEKRKKLKSERIEAGMPFISPMIGPGYTPDAGVLFAIGGLLTFKTDRNDSLVQRSSLPVTFVVSSRGNLSFGSRLKSFWWQDKVRINVLFAFSDAKDDYFGVGYQNATDIPQGDSTTLYNRRSWIFNPEILFRLGSSLYAGVLMNLNQTNAVEINPLMAQDPSYVAYGPNNYNAGLGLTFQFDSRDIVVNAWRGLFASMTSTFYGRGLGSDNNYQILDLDVRHYRRIKRDGRTLAFRYKGRYGFGDVPWAEMTKLGGSRELRGYIKGQYRDISGMHFTTEYRHMFLKKNGELSPHGFAAWVATGSIFDGTENLDHWLPNAGVGYRLEVQPRMNLRIDFGLGKETTGVYFDFNEAF
jgi:outer membrane protein assembly factor BamA